MVDWKGIGLSILLGIIGLLPISVTLIAGIITASVGGAILSSFPVIVAGISMIGVAVLVAYLVSGYRTAIFGGIACIIVMNLVLTVFGFIGLALSYLTQAWGALVAFAILIVLLIVSFIYGDWTVSLWKTGL
jgi:hypothetical protein